MSPVYSTVCNRSVENFSEFLQVLETTVCQASRQITRQVAFRKDPALLLIRAIFDVILPRISR